LRICRGLNIKSTIKYSNNGCTRQARNPQYIAENILDRKFTADAPNEKWLTDVTEFHYYIGIEKHKVYLSAILDLYDRRIVSYVISNSNNNAIEYSGTRSRDSGRMEITCPESGNHYKVKKYSLFIYNKYYQIGVLCSSSLI
jgi:transposase InsO family protein